MQVPQESVDSPEIVNLHSYHTDLLHEDYQLCHFPCNYCYHDGQYLYRDM
eukprot:Gb_07576 [translate_table: standard]